MTEQTCDGCKHLIPNSLGDGSTSYGCEYHPGLCIGDRGLHSNPKYDEPKRCERYEK